MGQGKMVDIELTYNFLTQILKDYGWFISKNINYGSAADICVEHKEYTHIIIIDDGRVKLSGALFHIYSDHSLKIFEGRIETVNELEIVLKTLGYKKK